MNSFLRSSQYAPSRAIILENILFPAHLFCRLWSICGASHVAKLQQWWCKRYYDVNANHLPVTSPRTSSRTNRDKEINSFLPVTALRIDYVASFFSQRRPLQRAVPRA